MKRLQLILLFLFLTITGYALAKAEEAAPQPIYIKLEPPFVVNVDDGETLRFLQVNTEIQFSDQLAQPILEKHLPAIRHAMIMLLSGQPAKEIKTSKGKEDLRTAALKEVQKVMTDNTGKPVIEALYFTGFIIQ